MLTPLHILTALTRPQNLPRLAKLIDAAAQHGIAVHWHIGLDLDRRHIGGQAVKNRLLDGIVDGWVWVCDDDNLPHPAFFARLAQLDGTAPGYLFGQRRGPAEVLAALPPAIDHCDVAQVVVRRSTIGSLRLPERYNGDGTWLMALHAAGPLVLVDEPLTYWNAAEWLP